MKRVVYVPLKIHQKPKASTRFFCNQCMSLQVKSAIKDVAPGISDPLPPPLVSYCDRLYGQSLSKPLNRKNEVARYHLCAYLSVEKYASLYNLPDPQFRRIPLPPKLCLQLIDEFRAYMQNVKSAASSPVKSPLKPSAVPSTTSPLRNRTTIEPESPTRRKRPASPLSDRNDTESDPFTDAATDVSSNTSTPRRGRPSNPHRVKNFMGPSPSKSSPLKRLRAAAEENGDTDDSDYATASPFNTPGKDSALKSAPSTPQKETELNITIPELIQLCNTFFIPGYVTVHIIQEFLNQRYKFVRKGDYYLAYGLIYAAYSRINHKIFYSSRENAELLVTQLSRQKKSTKRTNVSYWTTVVNEAVSRLPWVLELENTFMYGGSDGRTQQRELAYKLGAHYNRKDTTGSMIGPQSDLLSESQTNYYNTWTSKVLQQLE